LVEGTISQHQQVMPQSVLLKTFWLGSETSVLFTKHINILADWVILSHRELNRKNDVSMSFILQNNEDRHIFFKGVPLFIPL